MPDTTSTQQHQHQHQLSGFVRCKYPGKLCRQQRARKRNGQLHRFCEEHRSRANDNQKRWSASRLQRWEAMALSPGEGANTTPTNSSKNHFLDSRFVHQEMEIMAMIGQVQGIEYHVDSLQFPLHFPGVDISAFATGLEEPVSADLDGFLQDLFTTPAPDGFVCEVSACEPTWIV